MRTRLALLTGVLLLALSACSGGGDDAPEDLTPRLEAAKKQLDDAESLSIDLATKSLPSGVTGLLSAKGSGNHDPAFEGKVTVVTGGASVDADVVSLEGSTYAKIGFVPGFNKVSPASLKAPDPAQLLATSGGISDLLPATKGVKSDGQSRDGDDVLTKITGTLPGDTVRTLIPTADEGGSFSVVYRLTDDDEIRDATLKGPFYPQGGDVTYTLKVTTSDDPVEITKP